MPQTTEAVSKVLTSNRLPDWRRRLETADSSSSTQQEY